MLQTGSSLKTNFLEVPIQPIPNAAPATFIADLDGDSRIEIILHRPRADGIIRSQVSPVRRFSMLTNGHAPLAHNLGINIREGEHYTQFMVYDLDGDGRAELACKTADGTKDGKGKIIGDGTKDWRNQETGSRRLGRSPKGGILHLFDGKTSARSRRGPTSQPRSD
jgi:rhamnogalacturonan endolyase